MITTTDIEWYRHARLPASVRLHYIAPDGRHPLTPDEIRERYVREVTDSSLVVWRSFVVGRFGFRAGIDELTWDLPRVGSIELALSSYRFEPALLDWFRPILTLLTEMFPGRVTERDDGYDA